MSPSRVEDREGDEPRPSKSARKRDAHAAQRLGEELIELRDAELLALALPEPLVAAVREARSIRSRGAGARQRQYIGRLMREVDVDAVRHALAERRRALAERRAAAGKAQRYNEPMQALVGIIMGSRSDWETLAGAAQTLDELAVPYEVRVISAHRTPDLLYEYASTARERGIKVIIAGAGGAAHLPGMTASKTTLPVLGVPVQTRTLQGLDSLLSIVQMPAGVPVATFAIGAAGAVNAALCAAQILAASFPQIDAALKAHRERQTQTVLRDPDPRAPLKP